MENPLIAEKDIPCYVYIRKELVGEHEEEHGWIALWHRLLRKGNKHIELATRYYEPFRNIKLRPNSMVKPKNESRRYGGKYNGINHYRVDDGFINGMLRSDYYGNAQPYNAIIPEGTEYYVNNGLFRIAARRLQIRTKASEPITNWRDNIKPILGQLSEYYFAENDEVKPGYYYIGNGKFVNPLDRRSDDFVLGIVTNVMGDRITVMSLDEEELIWCPEYKYENLMNKPLTDGIHKYNESDENGEENTLRVIRSSSYDIDCAAVNWCNRYGMTRWDNIKWHLGSASEVISAVRDNMLQINVAIALYGDDYPLLNSLGWYWTSTEFDDSYALCVDATDGTVVPHKKASNGMVRAFSIIERNIY